MAWPPRVWPRVKSYRTLRIQHRHICKRVPVAEMGLICRKPIKKRTANLAPARIFRRTAQPVKPGHHATRRGLSEWHGDRKSTRLNSSPHSDLVCRLLLEKKTA